MNIKKIVIKKSKKHPNEKTISIITSNDEVVEAFIKVGESTIQASMALAELAKALKELKLPNDFEDSHYMTFGKYGPDNGDHRRIIDVPTPYLHYLWHQCGFNMNPANQMHRYIFRNRERLMADDVSLKWNFDL